MKLNTILEEKPVEVDSISTDSYYLCFIYYRKRICFLTKIAMFQYQMDSLTIGCLHPTSKSDDYVSKCANEILHPSFSPSTLTPLPKKNIQINSIHYLLNCPVHPMYWRLQTLRSSSPSSIDYQPRLNHPTSPERPPIDTKTNNNITMTQQKSTTGGCVK